MITVADLRNKAREMKIKGFSTMNKGELEKALGIPKPSAYRAMRLSKLDLIQPSPETESRLKRWKAEDWVNLTAKLTDGIELPCGTRGKQQDKLKVPTVCRPTKKQSKETPSLASNFSKAQIEKAIELKKRGLRIDWKKL
jgi:hypothetical protein